MNIAIVGATGNVGRKTLEILERKEFSIDNLYLVAFLISQKLILLFLQLVEKFLKNLLKVQPKIAW